MTVVWCVMKLNDCVTSGPHSSPRAVGPPPAELVRRLREADPAACLAAFSVARAAMTACGSKERIHTRGGHMLAHIHTYMHTAHTLNHAHAHAFTSTHTLMNRDKHMPLTHTHISTPIHPHTHVHARTSPHIYAHTLHHTHTPCSHAPTYTHT